MSTLTRTDPTTRPDLLRRFAGWAAGGYVAIFVLAIFGNFLALDPTIQPGEPTATADALREAGTIFRLGIAAFLGIFLADVVVAWALYELFAPVRRSLSLLAAWFRLAYTVVLGAAMGLLFVAVELAERGTTTGDEGVLLALQAFDFTWVVGLAAFGAHLLLVARLLVAAAGPRWLAVVLALAGSAYVVDTVAHIVLADYEAYAGASLMMVALPSVVGELAFTIWLFLVARGRRSLAVGTGD